MISPIRWVGVVIPAHNEESLLGDSLDAIEQAAVWPRSPTTYWSCSTTAPTAASTSAAKRASTAWPSPPATWASPHAAGFQAIIGLDPDPAAVWLASTDADTRVEPTWLRRQLHLARRGADVVLGVVRLDRHTASNELDHAFDLDYHKKLFHDGSHHHVHGANLGLRASVYLQAGGFPPIPDHEDRHLIQQLRRTPGVIIEQTQHLIVSTSARLDGRCRHGFAATLAVLNAPAPS